MATGSTYTLTGLPDSISGTADDDLIVVPPSNANLEAADSITAGDGFDTMQFNRTGSVTISYLRLTGTFGVDAYDFNAASSVLFSVDDGVITRSDSNEILIEFGTATLSLDLRDVTAGSGTVNLWGSGAVTLFDAVAQEVQVAAGYVGASNIIGGSGRDTIIGGTGADTLTGAAGSDALSGGDSHDVLAGGDDADQLIGGAGDDQLSGDAGHDLLTGGTGSNTQTGGTGSDTHVVTAGETLTITDFDATDVYERIDLRAFAGVGFADLTITANGGNARVDLPGGGTSIILSGVSAAALNAGNFVFDGNDVQTLAAALSIAPDYQFTAGSDNFAGGAGDQVFELFGSNANLDATDTIAGGAGTDVLRLLGSDRSLSAERLAGMSGVEVIDLSGATGNHVVIVDDVVTGQSDTGVMTVKHGAAGLLIDSSVAPDADSVVVEGTGTVTLYDAPGQAMTVSDFYGGTIAGGDRDDIVIGGAMADSLSGGAGNDTLSGMAGNDTLEGGDGNDLLTTGTGTVTMTGGTGADTFVVTPGATVEITDFAGSAGFEQIDLRGFAGVAFGDITILDNGGNALVQISGSTTEITLTGVAAGTLSAGDFLFEGQAATQTFLLTTGADSITGGAGDDLIDLAGNIAGLDASMDTIDGGDGIDTLRVFGIDRSLGTARLDALSSIEVIDLTGATGTNEITITDYLVASSNTGNILVRHGDANLFIDSSTVALPEQVTVEGSGLVTLRDVPGQVITVSDQIGGHVVGGNDDNTIVGGAQGDHLDGGELHDTIDGRGGDDTLMGGDGFDTLTSGTGNDLLDGGLLEDWLISNGGNDTLTGGSGDDHFVIKAAAGTTTFTDYDPQNLLERIDLTDLAGLSSVADLSIVDEAGNARITAPDLNLLIEGVAAADIDRDDFIFAGQDALLFHVDPSTPMDRLQHLLDNAPANAVVQFAAGTYDFTQTIIVHRSDITLKGAGEDQTIFRSMVPATDPGPTLRVQFDDFADLYGTITADAAKGATQIQLAPGHDVAVGDILWIGQPNDDAWLAETGNTGWTPPDDPTPDDGGIENWLRELRSEVVAVNGDTITLADPLPYAFAAGAAEVQRSNFLSNVHLSDFTIQGVWGAPDKYNFDVTLPEWEGRSAFEVDGVYDSTLTNISVLDSASHAFRLQRLYNVTGDNLTAQGNHNKAGGNGYGFMIFESFANTMTNLTALDNRHALLFTSYSAEHYNSFHILETNRDINFHGSPDADNTVIVDLLRQEYLEGTFPQFDAVQGGSFPLHPYWTIEDNDVFFRDAISAERNDTISAHPDGGRLSTGIGNDSLIGGIGNDTLDGGENGDILTGGAGRDEFLRQHADFIDTITDFETGAGGDVMVLIGSAYSRFNELSLTQDGADVVLSHGTEGHTRFQNTQVADFTADNFRFERDREPGQTFVLKATDDFAVGTDIHDRFELTGYQTDNPAFRLVAGTGLDTVAYNIKRLTGALEDTGDMTGVDIYDVSGALNANISVSNIAAALSDIGRLTLAVGDDTTASAVELAVNPLGRGRTISIDGSRSVQLTDGQGHVVKSTDRIGVNITGGNDTDLIFGGRSDDYFNGGAGRDTFLSSAGDDTLDGGPGPDIMNGGPGSDVYIIDDLGDRVAESRRWDGTDHVITSVDFLLGRDHVENLTLVGTGNIRGIGNGLENRIIGNDGNNIIDGGPRADYLEGGLGNDTYFVRAVGDQVIERAGEGIDTVKALFSFALPDEVENLHLLTTVGINGFGNAMDNTIIGNQQDNVIDGQDGNDRLIGSGGADTFRFLSDPGAGNVDTIEDFTYGVDRIMLLGSNHGGVARGALDPAAFHIGATASDAGDRVIYDDTTGNLYIDADGSGAGAQVLFAQLTGAPTLDADSFIFV